MESSRFFFSFLFFSFLFFPRKCFAVFLKKKKREEKEGKKIGGQNSRRVGSLISSIGVSLFPPFIAAFVHLDSYTSYVSFIFQVDGGKQQFVVNIYWCLFERGTKEGFIGIECERIKLKKR